MKVAFATTDGIYVNEHFGRAGMFAIYELREDGYTFVEMRKFSEGRDSYIEESKGMGEIHSNRVEAKIERLKDCKIIYFSEIGPPSAARLINKGIMPVKIKDSATIKETIEKLLESIKKSPPPWLKKALKEQ
ncbi:MAG: nitrogen fixation protein NifX [Thermodesulfovibrionales bacterium]|nr:nitrogen fixation protein NifX [Thermodesulfovibrionales bacterium]